MKNKKNKNGFFFFWVSGRPENEIEKENLGKKIPRRKFFNLYFEELFLNLFLKEEKNFFNFFFMQRNYKANRF